MGGVLLQGTVQLDRIQCSITFCCIAYPRLAQSGRDECVQLSGVHFNSPGSLTHELITDMSRHGAAALDTRPGVPRSHARGGKF